MSKHNLYCLGAAWFGAVSSVIGFRYDTWQFWLVLLSYVVIGSALKTTTPQPEGQGAEGQGA
jgi:hypothetical protein